MIYGIVGNRVGWSRAYVFAQLKQWQITARDTIVSGGCMTGVDVYAREYAKQKGCKFIEYFPDPLRPVPQKFFERNAKIAEECDMLIAFDKVSGGKSGTSNTINHAEQLDKPVKIYK